MILKIVACAIYVVSILLLFFRSRQSVRIVPYFYLLIAQIFSLISLVMIESGSWIMEEQRYGYENGAFWLYLVFCLVSLGGYMMGALSTTISPVIYSLRKTDRREFFCMISGMILFLGFFGFAFVRARGVSGFDSHNFLTYTYPVWTITFTTTAMNALGWYGLFRIDEIGKKIFFGLLYALNLRLAGSEFGGYVTLGLVLFISIAMVGRINFIKLFMGGLIVFGGASLVKIYITVVKGHPWNFVLDRLAEQGHVFWYSVNRWSEGKSVNLGFSEWLRNFFHFHYVVNENYGGVGNVMTSIDASRADNFFKNGIVFATDSQGVLLIGPGLLISIFLIFLWFFFFPKFFFFLVKMAREYSFILFILLFRLFSLFDELRSGDFGFFNIKITGYIFLFCLLYFGMRKYFTDVFLIRFHRKEVPRLG